MIGRPANPLFVALDTPDAAHAETLARRLAGHVGGIKLGLEFFSAAGPEGVRRLSALGLPVFLDLKLHDIPNTVASAIKSLLPLRVSYLTVHAAGGRAMLEAAQAAASSSAAGPALLAVTVLTSLDEDDLAATGIAGPVTAQSARLARLAVAAGLPGLVSSAHEIAGLRATVGPAPLIVTPGIRRAGEEMGDQKRTISAGEARRRGADILVVGRPITAAADPLAAAASFLDEVRAAA